MGVKAGNWFAHSPPSTTSTRPFSVAMGIPVSVVIAPMGRADELLLLDDANSTSPHNRSGNSQHTGEDELDDTTLDKLLDDANSTSPQRMSGRSQHTLAADEDDGASEDDGSEELLSPDDPLPSLEDGDCDDAASLLSNDC